MSSINNLIEYKSKLSQKWIKASLLGTIWAVSEIILGSFLHNLHIPFSSSILTGIGIILLISSTYRWDDKGIFWRSGIICGLLKSLSPSHVIFAPMIAIIMESILIEFSIRLFGRNFFSYILGGILAMTWTIFQKFIALTIIFGNNFVEIYNSLLAFSRKHISNSESIFINPIIILFIIYFVLGLISTIFGIYIGKKSLNIKQNILINNKKKSNYFNRISKINNYSIFWLFANFFLVISNLYLINFSNIIIWLSSSTITIILWIYRYKNSLNYLKKRKFWLTFITIFFIFSFVLGYIQYGSFLSVKNLIIAIQINIRSTIIMIGFSTIGQELYNPKIQKFLNNNDKLINLNYSLKFSYTILPQIINYIPNAKTFFLKPSTVAANLFNIAEYFISYNEKEMLIISAKKNQGKTSLMKDVYNLCREKNKTADGFFSEKIIQNNEVVGYNINFFSKNKTIEFLNLKENAKENQYIIGNFAYDENLFITNIKPILDEMLNNNSLNEILLIDEIGKLEINNYGFYNFLNEIHNTNYKKIILTVRNNYCETINKKFFDNKAKIININNLNF